MLSPEKHTFDTIWGHEAARRFVPRLLGQGRLPHAILLTGPDAIGKRSLAFAMAKAILSAGMAPAATTLNAPSPAGAKRTISDEPEDEDLFGEAEADLFGDAPQEEEPAPPPPTVKATEPKPAPAPKESFKPAAHTPGVTARPFVGYDERVCRLIEASYPQELDKEGRSTKPGHLDLTIIEPTGGRRGIVVDQIRGLQDTAVMSPVEGAYRVVLIFGADTITQEAGNSILKLLEEPPPFLVMILVANRQARVLPTIKSRCAVIPMTPPGRALLVEKLVTEEKLERELAKVAAALSEGRPGVALSVVQAALLQKRRDVFDARLQLDRFGLSALPAAAARLNAAGKLDETLWLLLSFTRDRLVRACAPEQPALLVHGDATDLLDQVQADVYALDEEADRLVKACEVLAHPFIPNPRAVLQGALWPE